MSDELNGQLNEPVRRWRRYPAYKNSGLATGVQVPAHWSMMRLKHVAAVRPSNVDKKTVEGQEAVRLCNYVDVYKNDFITDDFDFMQASATPAQIAAFTLKAGDVIITKDSETWDDIAVPAYVKNDLPGVLCGYHLALVRPRPGVVAGEFLFRAFGAEGVCDQFRVAANGITRFGLDTASINDALFPVPPPIEQNCIVVLLDRETAKIDALIAKKDRLIELLQEKRSALISHAVTRGLDPNVSMKDSGVEWLGKIPARWNTKRLKFCLYKMEQGWSPSCENRIAEENEWGVLKVGCVNGTEFDPNENKALPSHLQPLPELEIRTGEVLMSRANTRELLGSCSVVRQIRPRLLLCDKLYRLHRRPNEVDGEFLVHALGSQVARFQMEREATGASGSMQNIAQSTVWNLTLPVPTLDEQRTIMEQIHRETIKLDGLIAKVRQGIDKLREYRTALISAAVTGKIDVREEVA
jgi:type I restriction enzyme S subunit